MTKFNIVCSILLSVTCVIFYYLNSPASVFILAVSNLTYAIGWYLEKQKYQKLFRDIEAHLKCGS